MDHEFDEFKIEFEYAIKAARLELFIRIPYVVVLAFFGGLWGFIAGIATLIQWIHVLITGRRNHKLWKFTARFLHFYVRFWSYAGILTDIRPFSRSWRTVKEKGPTRMCQNCHTELPEGAVYCPECGRKV